MVPFSFEVGFQRAILRLMMIDQAFTVKALKWVTPSHFTSEPLGWIYKQFQAYYEEYAGAPTDVVLRDYARRVLGENAVRFSTEVELVIAKGEVPEAEFIKVKLKDFIRQGLFSLAHQDSALLFNDGKQAEAYDIMMRAMESVHEVGFEQDDRIWLADSFYERNRDRVREFMTSMGTSFSTGVSELDQATDGGVAPGELWAVFAYAKRCKTTWLINQGFNALRVHRKKVVHFVLEGSGKQIASRYDACFSQELYSQVKQGRMDPQRYAALSDEYATLRKMCAIRTLNNWDINILHLEGENQLASEGFRPELMIVDYMDLGRARGKVDGEREHQIGFARDLKRLVNNSNLACWSAWQAQRPPKNAHTRIHTLDSSQVADAYAKVRIVDSFGSLNATDEEMAEGTMRLFWEGHRDAPVNQTWQITNDLSRMRMAQSSELWVPPNYDDD